MAGTKMTLHRYGSSFVYWDEHIIIVNKKYLTETDGLHVHIPYKYIMNIGQLDVFLNGHRLLEKIEYEEVDPHTILLKLGIYPEGHPKAGQPIPLQEGDKLYIRVWKLEYMQGGSGDYRTKLLEKEIMEARKYREDDDPFPSLDNRLDYIQERAEVRTMVFSLGRVSTGVAKLILPFPYSGVIVKATASCVIPGETQSVFQIEKCAQEDLDTQPVWNNILSTNLSIDANKSSSKTASVPYTIKDFTVNEDDHFRINVVECGEGIEGVTIEVLVKV